MRVGWLCGIVLACATPAAATVVTTLTGIVADAQGNVGAASPFGAILAGQSTYRLVYTIDDGVSGAAITSDSYGKRVSGAGSVTAALTINGVTRTIGGRSTAVAANRNDEPDSGRSFDRVLRTAQDFTFTPGGLYSDSYAQTAIDSYLSNFLTNGDYATPFTYTSVSADSYLSNVHFNDFDFATNTQITNVYLSLAPGFVTNVVSGAVPESSSWTMMVLGFAAVGFGMRRRRGGLATA